MKPHQLQSIHLLQQWQKWMLLGRGTGCAGDGCPALRGGISLQLITQRLPQSASHRGNSTAKSTSCNRGYNQTCSNEGRENVLEIQPLNCGVEEMPQTALLHLKPNQDHNRKIHDYKNLVFVGTQGFFLQDWRAHVNTYRTLACPKPHHMSYRFLDVYGKHSFQFGLFGGLFKFGLGFLY